MVHLFLSYCKSHIYELHAILAATITVVMYQFLKRPLKVKISSIVTERFKNHDKWRANERLYLKRCNIIILILAYINAFVLFTIIALISPMILFSFRTGIMCGIYALAEYAVLDQLLFGWERWQK